MAKSSKKPRPAQSAVNVADARPLQATPAADNRPKRNPESKQARVLDMLQASSGTTIAAMMKQTGWQQHSVRGFLAGVVRKRLKLKLSSKKVDGERVYKVASSGGGKSQSSQTKRRPS